MFLLAALLNLAILTTDKYPNKEDDELLKCALHECNVLAQSINWHAADTDWSQFDAVLVLSTWDYYENHSQFLSLLKKIKQMDIQIYNPLPIIEWNSCKTYLKDLEKWGLKTIESIYISKEQLNTLPTLLIERGWDECVIKPQISTSGHGTYRFNLSSFNALKLEGEQFIVQPFAREVVEEGEWSFVFFDNQYMHCMLKKPDPGEFLVQKGTKIYAEPEAWMLQEVKNAVQALNLPLVHLRIDVIRRGNEIRIMELEMIEPSLFLKYFPGSEKIFAQKIKDCFSQMDCNLKS
jgi:hypothetical protein